jgi:hypothetical protein
LKETVADSRTREEFSHPRGKAFAKESSGTSPVIVKFDEKSDEETRVKMGGPGLKWNAIRGERQGMRILKS